MTSVVLVVVRLVAPSARPLMAVRCRGPLVELSQWFPLFAGGTPFALAFGRIHALSSSSSWPGDRGIPVDEEARTPTIVSDEIECVFDLGAEQGYARAKKSNACDAGNLVT